VQVYIDNGSGTSSAALIARVGDVLRGYTSSDGTIFPGWVAAGIRLDVFGVTAQPVDVVVAVSLVAGTDQASAVVLVQSAIADYMRSLQVFAPVIVSEIVAAVMSVDGVSDVRMVAPLTNVSTGVNQRIVLGLVTVQIP